MTDYTILLIDYAPRSVAQLRAPLEAAGYVVEVAENGPLGFEAFQRIEPDLTLIEPMLPKKPGLEVCKELKESPLGQDSPILILTSIYQGRRYRDQAQKQSHCDGFLDKPVREDALLSTVEQHLAGRQPRSRRPDEPAPTAAKSKPEEPRPVDPAPRAESLPHPPAVEPTMNRDMPLAAAAGSGGNGKSSGPAPRPAVQPGFSDATEAEILARLDAIMPD